MGINSILIQYNSIYLNIISILSQNNTIYLNIIQYNSVFCCIFLYFSVFHFRMEMSCQKRNADNHRTPTTPSPIPLRFRLLELF